MAGGSSGDEPMLARIRRQATRGVRRRVHRQARRWRNRPPVVSRNWAPAPPDFVGVGVQRAATSWWFSLIEAHPGVHPLSAAAKELHYFEPFWRHGLSASEIAAYHAHFRRPPGQLCGEWTPRYMFDPWTPALLRRAAPEARILVMLRDPVARLRSGLTHALERGKPVEADTVDNAVARGFYHGQLTRLMSHYPRHQVLILQFERCLVEPEAMLRRTQGFLGLDEVVPTGPLTQSVNRATIDQVSLSGELLAEVAERYAADARAVAADFPEIDLDLWPSCAHLGSTS